MSTVQISAITCPLCNYGNPSFFYKDKPCPYYRCPQCHLIFVPEDYHLTEEEEKKRYDLHQNSPADKDYRRFLCRLFNPLHNKLLPHSFGLDFGSGPGPTLHLIFEEAGHTMEIYDFFYANNTSVFEQSYDFITNTEVVEHLSNPGMELNRLWQCLKPGGYLGIMTKRVPKKRAFKDWHYIRDDTHIAFYSTFTFRWLADQWNAKVEFFSNDVALLRKGD